MKNYIITLCLILLASQANGRVSEEYKILDGMLSEIAETLEVVNPHRFIDGTFVISHDTRLVELKHLYRWSGDLVSETKIQEIVEALEPYIKEIEQNYPGYKCRGRSFMLKEHADEYSDEVIPEFSLGFTRRSGATYKEMWFKIQFIHTSPNTLFLNATSIEPIKKTANTTK
ncbi:MAG: hypothetical protein ACSHX8_13830 [Opitutaceae bacterium]